MATKKRRWGGAGEKRKIVTKMTELRETQACLRGKERGRGGTKREVRKHFRQKRWKNALKARRALGMGSILQMKRKEESAGDASNASAQGKERKKEGERLS